MYFYLLLSIYQCTNKTKLVGSSQKQLQTYVLRIKQKARVIIIVSPIEAFKELGEF